MSYKTRIKNWGAFKFMCKATFEQYIEKLYQRNMRKLIYKDYLAGATYNWIAMKLGKCGLSPVDDRLIKELLEYIRLKKVSIKMSLFDSLVFYIYNRWFQEYFNVGFIPHITEEERTGKTTMELAREYADNIEVGIIHEDTPDRTLSRKTIEEQRNHERMLNDCRILKIVDKALIPGETK